MRHHAEPLRTHDAHTRRQLISSTRPAHSAHAHPTRGRLHFEGEERLPLQLAIGAATAAAAVFGRYAREHAATYPQTAPPPRNPQVHLPWADFTAHLKRCATAASTAATAAPGAAAGTKAALAAGVPASKGKKKANAAATAAAAAGEAAVGTGGAEGAEAEGCYCLQLALGVRGTRTYGESVFESEMIGRDCTEELLFHVQDALEAEPMASLLKVCTPPRPSPPLPR